MAAHSILFQEAPPGTPVHIRLTGAVGSYASRKGAPVEAVLIAPVAVAGRVILPAGSVVTGEIKSVRRVGLGIVHETSSMALDFNSVRPPEGTTTAIATRLAAVDNAREAVTPAGSIIETRSTGTFSSRAMHYLRFALMEDVHARMVLFASKAIFIRIPEPEIYLPAGAELTLTLTEPVFGSAFGATAFGSVGVGSSGIASSGVGSSGVASSDDAPRKLNDAERALLAPAIAAFPDQASTAASFAAGGRPSDLINVMLIGSRGEIAAAFEAGGWSEAHATSFRSGMKDIFAVMENRGNQNAPMSPMWVNGLPADMSWEKGLNNLAKRHHVRLWKQGTTEDGREIWIGAATRDVDFAYMRPGRLMTHRIAEQVDHERDKVANDLAFTDCVESLDWWDRPDIQRRAKNATGDWMETDGRLAVVELNDCREPRAAVAALADPLPVHGRMFQRILRQQILSARSDLIRGNPYWAMYARARMALNALRQLRRTQADPDRAPEQSLASRLRPDAVATIVSLR